LTSIEAKPKIAFVGTPVDVAIDSGSAKKARYTRLGPSIRNSRRSVAVLAGAAALSTVVLLGDIDSSLYEDLRSVARTARAAATRGLRSNRS
jgi:hypothetical protein